MANSAAFGSYSEARPYIQRPIPAAAGPGLSWVQQKFQYVSETIQWLVDKIKDWFISFQEWLVRPPSPRVILFPPAAAEVPQTLVEKISNTLPKTQQVIAQSVESAIQ